MPEPERPHEPQRSWLLALRTLAFASALVWLVVLAGSLRDIGKPFPGFHHDSRLSVWITSAPEWNGGRAGLVPLDRIRSVDGKAISTASELEAMVRAVPVGTPFEYEVERQGKTRQIRVATQRYGLREFAFVAVPQLLLGLCYLGSAIVPFWLRPGNLAAQACLLLGLSGGLVLTLNVDWVGERWFGPLLGHLIFWIGGTGILLSQAFPEPRPWLVKRPWLAALTLLPAFAIPWFIDEQGTMGFMVYGAYTLAAVGILVAKLAAEAVRSPRSLARARSQVVLLGVVLAAAPPVAADLVFATWAEGDVPAWLYRSGIAFTVLFPLSVAYAILKHQLFDIEMLVKRTIVYGAAAVALGTTYFAVAAGIRLGIEGLFEASGTMAGNVLATALVTVSFGPVRDRIKAWVEQRFYRSPYDFKQVVSSFQEAAQQGFETESLVEAFFDHADGALHPSYMAIVIRDEAGAPAIQVAERGEVPEETRSVRKDHPLWRALESARATGPVPAGPDGALAWPLRFREELLGFVVAGPLRSELEYGEQDRLLMLTLSREVALRLKSAQLHSRTEALVARRTAELDQALTRLRVAYDDLKELDELKAAFLNTVTHELRTPLTFILGFAHILAEMDEAGEGEMVTRRQYAEHIMNGARQLERLVDDLLDIARIEAGQLRLDLRDLDLAALMKDVGATMAALAGQKRIRLRLEVAEDLPLVRGDTVRVTQIFNNLVSNAIKFTPDLGDVVIRAFPDGEGSVRCEVVDTGIGIPQEAQGHLFTRFYQVDSTLHRSAKGLGLGLAITKSLVEGHGGAIGVESVPGTGSRFWFTLAAVGAQTVTEREAAV